jgi:hypothetical protein
MTKEIKPLEKTVNLQNFIGVYDNYITPEMCNRAIKLFEEENKFNKTVNRQDSDKVSALFKQDKRYGLNPQNINFWWEDAKPIIINFELALKHYIKNTGITKAYSQEEEGFYFNYINIQKTLPTEGYHVWHIEHGKGFYIEPRVLVYTVYLNDVEEGGETEFLHFSKRVKPKTGRIVIWPAGFPYLHRGNPPLSGEKYILTSWLSLR